MLPNESLLQVLHFVDYRALVLAKLAGAPLLCVATKYAAELARRRSFRVTFFAKWITCDGDGERRKSIRYEAGDRASLADACREVAELVGPHAVANLMFSENTSDMPYVGVVFEAAPPLKFAEEVAVHSVAELVTVFDSEAFMSNFSGMKTLRLGLNYDAFRQFSWTFLRKESARELRLIKFTRPWQENVNMTRFVIGLVRFCTTLPRLQGGEALELDFSQTVFSGAFAQRIIKLLKGTGRELTFRMRTPQDGELELDESEYTPDVDDNTTRYASEESGRSGGKGTLRRYSEHRRRPPEEGKDH
ncbi:hypothetical protein AAVH_26451 [Aphelenchoides avenae]|nr:hypothetical protein AAVH_26451 [Aphelenchus avenae]